MIIKNRNFFDEYEVLEEIGEGGQATVYLAQRNLNSNQYAVKVIEKQSMNPKELQYIYNEIEIMNIIEHPNIVKMIQCFETEENIFIVLEFMQGGELYERIIEKEVFTENEAINVLTILVDALKYCHSKGIIHRDLKPENILYQDEEENSILKIADFGVSKILNNPKELTSTIIGTNNYIAPEIMSGKKYTSKCDTYSLGIIFYTMLCGYPPFNEDDPEYKNKAFKGMIDFPENEWQNISEMTKQLVLNLLNPDPQQRFELEKIYQICIQNKGKKQNLNIQKKLEDYVKRRKFKATQLAIHFMSLLKKKNTKQFSLLRIINYITFKIYFVQKIQYFFFIFFYYFLQFLKVLFFIKKKNQFLVCIF